MPFLVFAVLAMTLILNVLLLTLFLIQISNCTIGESTTSNTVFGKLKHGLHMASKFLGLDRASEVAKLVSDAFGKSQKKGDEGGSTNIFSGLLRILGFDAKKIGAIAVNAIIFFAQLISTSLTVTPPSKLSQARVIKDGTPLEWMMNNSVVFDLIVHAKGRSLPDNIIKFIKERSLDEETDCTQLLVCKASPIIWSMQKVLDVRQNKTSVGLKRLFELLPSVDEFSEYGEKCERKHPYCFINL